MKRCYFLVFRLPRSGGQIAWDHPTGGLVMEADRVFHGIGVADFDLAREILEQRYHCHADEHLLIAEVFEPDERMMAAVLHDQWEHDAQRFMELMNL